MARLGVLMLASVLLGWPRAFRAASGAALRRSRYVEPAPSDTALQDFLAALQPVIDEHCHSLAVGGGGGATVVEVHRVLSQRTRMGWRPAEAISVSVEADGGVERLVLHGRAGRRAGAARALVRWLERDPPEGTSPRLSRGSAWA